MMICDRFLRLVLCFCVFVICARGCLLAAQQPAVPPPQADSYVARPRLMVLSDIGNEPDDQMSLVRLLLYSNEIDIEGLIATTSTWQKTATHPEIMRRLVEAYGSVRGNLLLHAAGWPEAGELEARVAAGQGGYGMADTGAGRSSAGAQAIVRAAERDDARPLWIALWGGANTLAQALVELRATKSAAEVDRIVARLRVSSISDQDDAGPWIRREFPRLIYIVKPSGPSGVEYQYATWTGISGDRYYRNCDGADGSLVTNEWLETNIRAKGPLGKLYPHFMFIMEGDTPSFLPLIDNGLDASVRPDWGGWGGRYQWLTPYAESHPIWTQGGDLFGRVTSADTVQGVDGRSHVSDQATIWRWREAYQNDFAARMSWTVDDFAHANHAPVLVVNGQAGTAPIFVDAKVGEPLVLDAAGSRDPDGQAIHYHWFQYAEAGAADASLAAVTLAGEDTARVTVMGTATCRPKWLDLGTPCPATGVAHLILAATDEGTPRLTSYRRVVVTVKGSTAARVTQ